VYYEVIFEDGSHSIAGYESDEMAVAAISAAHERAIAGGRSMESVDGSPPAVRVVKVLKYEEHPATLNESQTLPVEVLKESFAAVIKGEKEVNVHDVANAMREASSPVAVSEPHESNYYMEEEGELEGPWQ
jgi:hypothetical protein